GCGTDSPLIVADTTLEQAVHNVINNAADASPEDIAIEALVKGDSLEVTVSDRGPGVPVEVLDRAGLDTLAGHSDGLGIGLLLAFSAVERCGGDITFQGRPGGGTIATLTLPLSSLSPA
ncbi:MAG: ATP-binding protein, partial [Zoogloea sp.]|nr:ATP-binding protein [Zoogloea sp.]